MNEVKEQVESSIGAIRFAFRNQLGLLSQWKTAHKNLQKPVFPSFWVVSNLKGHIAFAKGSRMIAFLCVFAFAAALASGEVLTPGVISTGSVTDKAYVYYEVSNGMIYTVASACFLVVNRTYVSSRSVASQPVMNALSIFVKHGCRTHKCKLSRNACHLVDVPDLPHLVKRFSHHFFVGVDTKPRHFKKSALASLTSHPLGPIFVVQVQNLGMFSELLTVT